jgi:hypothetical protein
MDDRLPGYPSYEPWSTKTLLDGISKTVSQCAKTPCLWGNPCQSYNPYSQRREFPGSTLDP